MSRQAKIRTKSIVEYKSIPLFNHDCENLENFLVEEGIITTYSEVDADWCSYNPNWQISKSGLNELVKKLEQMEYDEILFEGFTVRKLVDLFKSWIELSSNEDCYSDADFIYIDWF